MTKASAPESSAARLLRLSRQGMAVLLRLNPYMERQEGYSWSRSRSRCGQEHAGPFVQHPQVPQALGMIGAAGLVLIEQTRGGAFVQEKPQSSMQRKDSFAD